MPKTTIDPSNFNEEMGHDKDFASNEESLVSYIMGHVDEWKRHRDQNYEDFWNECYRLWRGQWEPQDATRESERSKIISPATMQAVESTKAELEEAALKDGLNFDITDNYADERTDFQSPEDREKAQKAMEQIQQAVQDGEMGEQQAQQAQQLIKQKMGQRKTQDIEHMKNLMQERFEKSDVATALSKIFLNGCIYGTGIGKIVPEVVNEKKINPEEGSVEENPTVFVYLEAVSPMNFVIDPAATAVTDALGCAHDVNKPRHEVEQKQVDGIYRNISLGSSSTDIGDESPSKQSEFSDEDNTVRITEWTGLVPKSLIDGDEESEGAEEHVEAIVTIANGTELMRAMRSPYIMEDRPFVAYQHSSVPDVFWGRGVVEQAYNPQKALDAELRSRLDGLALSVHPMLAMDATKRVRGTNYSVSPGKTIFTNGAPGDSLMPFNFGDINAKTFQNAADLERMVQMATGAMDSAAPIENNKRNETASGMSMMMGGAVKRSKQTLRNIENNLIKPFLRKSAYRFMQFNPKEFPMKDLDFLPHSSLGIMAREVEQQQLVSLLQTVPEGSESFNIILKSIYQNSSLDNKEELMQSIDKAMQPDEMAQKAKQLELAKEQADIEAKKTQGQENKAKAFEAIQSARATAQEAELAQDKMDQDLMKQVLDVVASQSSQDVSSQTALAQEMIRATQQQPVAASTSAPTQGDNL